MKYVFYNPNPLGKFVGDCSIRAVSKLLNLSWEKVYSEIAAEGFSLCDMPSSNYVINHYLQTKGFIRKDLPNTCPDCYTIKDFCKDFPHGSYIVGTGTHLAAIQDASLWDSWDSSNEVVVYYWEKENVNG